MFLINHVLVHIWVMCTVSPTPQIFFIIEIEDGSKKKNKQDIFKLCLICTVRSSSSSIINTKTRT